MMLGSIREPEFDCQAFQSRPAAVSRLLRNHVPTLLCAILSGASPSPGSPLSPTRDTEIVAVAANAVPNLRGTKIESLRAIRCTPSRDCVAVPLQVDERDADHRWVLDTDATGAVDSSQDVVDDNDVLFFRPTDGAAPATPPRLPPHRNAALFEVFDPLDGRIAHVYVVDAPQLPAPAPPPLVRYDPQWDRLHSDRVTLGFQAGVPDRLAVAPHGDLLDRMKIRAAASLLWGLLRFERSEADLTTEHVGWRAGPLRLTRYQSQRVRLGWGIRSPRFHSYAFFYPGFVELPLALRLAHRPALLFGDIYVEMRLDFIDLRGWEVVAPGISAFTVGTKRPPTPIDVDARWFALRGPHATLLVWLDLGSSLESTRVRLVYDDSPSPDPPEDVPGERPGIGFRIERWDDVPAGAHHLRARAWALPPDMSLEAFLGALQNPLQVRVIAPWPQVSGDGGSETPRPHR